MIHIGINYFLRKIGDIEIAKKIEDANVLMYQTSLFVHFYICIKNMSFFNAVVLFLKLQTNLDLL